MSEETTEEETIIQEPAPEQLAPEVQHTAYCIKCRKKQVMINPTDSTFKNGTPVMRGNCPECGSVLHRIIARKN